MVNISTRINKMNNHLSPWLTECKKRVRVQRHMMLKSPGLGQAQKCGRVKPVNGIQTLPLNSITSPRNENVNLLVWNKFLIYYYLVLNKDWKICWSWPRGPCSSWGLYYMDNVSLLVVCSKNVNRREI